jgi:hypothetical protein
MMQSRLWWMLRINNLLRPFSVCFLHKSPIKNPSSKLRHFRHVQEKVGTSLCDGIQISGQNTFFKLVCGDKNSKNNNFIWRYTILLFSTLSKPTQIHTEISQFARQDSCANLYFRAFLIRLISRKTSDTWRITYIHYGQTTNLNVSLASLSKDNELVGIFNWPNSISKVQTLNQRTIR